MLMPIFFLSVTDNLNSDLKKCLADEIAKWGNKVAYISSEPQSGDRPYCVSTIADYSEISKDIRVSYFDLSDNFSDEALARLPEYGTIYLSGGNTYIFMDSARRRNVKQILKKHLDNGGLLIGASAGSLMMTPSIDIAGFADENTPGLTDMSGFGFVDFEFHPHFNGDEEERTFLSEYARKKNVKLYTCKDGGGIFYSEGRVRMFGGVSEFIIQ